MPTVPEYFTRLATGATTALADAYPNADQASLEVDTVPQHSAAAAWEATAVHPMQVLETGYQDIVRAAGAAARDQDARLDAEATALARFFTLGSSSPTLLEVPDGPVSTHLSGHPLIDDELARLVTQRELVRAMLKRPDQDGATLGNLADIVKTALDLVVAMAPAGVRRPLPPGLEQAADYLGLLDTGQNAPDALAAWVTAHQNYARDGLGGLLDELDREVIRPLTQHDNVLASMRALYNIEDFVLIRLMHRFEGGSAAAEMSLAQRRFASGQVTGAMHEPWIGPWHETQVSTLATALARLDAALREQLRTDRALIKFYLKGGRAMFTALGAPDEGSNDWDTGILIDPALPPDQWYTALAGVNDTILQTLDRLRFSYTQELYHVVPPGEMLAKGEAADPDPDNLALSDIADVAEDQLRRAESGLISTGRGHTAPHAALTKVVERAPGRVGVNGELIDVGIPSRSSVELRELWQDLEITERKGVSDELLPVPTLPYFVRDLATILREAVADSDGEPDRKLGKRLIRLARVLESADLVADVERWSAVASKNLPATVATVAPDRDTAEGRLQVFTLADLVTSLRNTDYLYPELDTYLAEQASHGALYDERDPVVTTIWDAIRAGIADAQQPVARSLLSTLAGTHRVARVILTDRRARNRALGVDLTAPIQDSTWGRIASTLNRLTEVNVDSARFVVGEALAAQLQLRHTGPLTSEAPPLDHVVVHLQLQPFTDATAKHTLAMAQRYVEHLGTAVVSGDGTDIRLRVSLDVVMPAQIGGAAPQVVLEIRPAPHSATPLDVLNGWLVAPARALVQGYLERAALTPDYDLRQEEHHGSTVLLQQVLGYPVGPSTPGGF